MKKGLLNLIFIEILHLDVDSAHGSYIGVLLRFVKTISIKN